MNAPGTLARGDDGYLLIEALVALALAATVATSLLALHIELRREGGLAALHGAAAVLGDAHIEWLTGTLRAGIDPGINPGSAPPPPGAGHGAQLVIEWTVAPAPDDTAALDIAVTRAGAAGVTWTFAGRVEPGAAADSGWGMQGGGDPPDGAPG